MDPAIKSRDDSILLSRDDSILLSWDDSILLSWDPQAFEKGLFMTYLSICGGVTKSSQSNFNGIINPKNYKKWGEVDPKILLFEGIHQFAVRSVKKYLEIDDKDLYLPIQIKAFTCHDPIFLCEHKVIGEVSPYGKSHQVAVEVRRGIHDESGVTVASGVVTVQAVEARA